MAKKLHILSYHPTKYHVSYGVSKYHLINKRTLLTHPVYHLHAAKIQARPYRGTTNGAWRRHELPQLLAFVTPSRHNRSRGSDLAAFETLNIDGVFIDAIFKIWIRYGVGTVFVNYVCFLFPSLGKFKHGASKNDTSYTIL